MAYNGNYRHSKVCSIDIQSMKLCYNTYVNTYIESYILVAYMSFYFKNSRRLCDMAYFPNIKKIQYEGASSTNQYAFKFYNPTEKVVDQTMEDILRFGVAYWHTFTMDGSDPFGDGNMIRPWDKYSGMDLAKARVDAAFEIFEKLDVPYFCFHDVDIAPEGNSLKESNRNIDEIVSMMKD